MTQLDSTGVAAVDHNYFWQPIETCPRGAKVQLLGRGGVAMYGEYHGKGDFYTHWAPLPKLKKEKTTLAPWPTYEQPKPKVKNDVNKYKLASQRRQRNSMGQYSTNK